jgi:hypothetical protein
MVKSIIIDDKVTLSPENGYLLQDITGLGFNVKYSVNELLSRHGAKMGNASFSGKKIKVVLMINGKSVEDLVTKRRNLQKNLNPNPYADNDTHTFKLVLIDDSVVYITGVVKGHLTPLSSSDVLAPIVSFDIETDYPLYRSVQQYVVDFAITKGGGMAIPAAIPANLSVGSVVGTSVTNGGTVFAYPVIRFYDTLTNPVLEDKDNGKQLTLTATIATGGWIEVDTYNETVKDHLGNNKLDVMSGDFLVIKEGENLFSLGSDVSGETGRVKIVYNYTYASI